MTTQTNLTETLGKLNDIAEWFEQQREVDVEEGLKKVKDAAGLIKASKARLKEIENEFIEIKADIQTSDIALGNTEESVGFEDAISPAEKEAIEEEIADRIPF